MSSFDDPAAAGVGHGAESVELGGETACWLARVCPGCDAVLDDEPPQVCPHCGRRVEPD